LPQIIGKGGQAPSRYFNAMKVYKFGGASVKNADGVKKIVPIIQAGAKGGLLVVVSAMGKTTNALEEIVDLAYKKSDFLPAIEKLRQYHIEIVNNLFSGTAATVQKLDAVCDTLKQSLNITLPYDTTYDQVVSLGEVMSTLIVTDFVAQTSPAEWIDARDYIVTNRSFREGKVDWDATRKKIMGLQSKIEKFIVITQGFIGHTSDGFTTTLGREGSDYSAAIFASCLKAESVTIWKDVPGVMTADPKRLPAAIVFDELPFQEAAEMTYYGASVIHPKTIKPLANANIALLVKNFDDPTLPGTNIHECKIENILPLVVFKDNQCLISCKVTDYTFITEEQLSEIFKTLSQYEVKINVMQNSAISFSFCVDYRESKMTEIIKKLSQLFEVYYNTGLTLITIKNYTPAMAAEYRAKSGVLLEQSSRSTLQLLMRGNAVPASAK
jgi:aspartate kinase